jgi:beta-N-acetylhexosaminidase
MKIFLLTLTLFLTLNASSINDTQLKKMIGRMLVIGFPNAKIDKNSQIVKDMKEYDLGGVILFDRDYKDKAKTKNISSPTQLKKLTTDLKKFSTKPLFISIDQEGGKVARLKSKYGFSKIPSAHEVSKMSFEDTVGVYEIQSSMLEDAEINMNFAPVVDLAVNPKNRVIVGLERSFGSDIRQVVAFSKVVIQEQKLHNIISVLKHFPGHGSSLGDSHKGFVDVSETWSPQELEPYKVLIDENQVDMIMTAHVFNSHIDDKYPATLSYKFNTDLLRNMMKFRGVIISDDLQMGAISQHYSLSQKTTLAINSGVDILLFANQLENVSVTELVNTIFKQVKSGAISVERIKESNARINNLHTKYSIIQKPIIFTDKRKNLTKQYIKSHYGFNVKDITIEPKTIVLHWTAVMDFEKSFKRLESELLFSDRADIAKASALNVSAHFLVARDGTIHQLMPDNWMARHVIGLNYSSIGIENVGGEANKKEDLTQAQLQANIALVNYLKAKYPTIKNVIGHYEYRDFENTPLWLEKDDGYRTKKSDPGEKFMRDVRNSIDK